MKLRQLEVLQGQGMSVAEAVCQIGVTQQTYYRWRRLHGGMNRDGLKRLRAGPRSHLAPLSHRLALMFACVQLTQVKDAGWTCLQDRLRLVRSTELPCPPQPESY